MPGLFDALMARETESQPPVSMTSNPIARLIEMLQGAPQDIELPNESGMVDPRLPDVGGSFRKAFDIANKYATGQGSALERLQKAGR